MSNLSLDKFINTCALLNELRTYTQSNNDTSTIQYNALDMFTNFLKTYNNISKPLPRSSNGIPNTLQYNVSVDIVLQYMMDISHILSRNIVSANTKEFDVYFVPPNNAYVYFPVNECHTLLSHPISSIVGFGICCTFLLYCLR